MSACAMSPYIKHSDGTVVESKLFNDLFSTFKNRGKAWRYYSIATNPKFLNTITQKVNYDSNGEITLDSFFRVASLRTDGDKAVALLEKSLGLKNEKYSYEDAIAKINSFNRHNTEHPGYMATMVLNNDGSYAVKVVQRNRQNKEYLKKTIKEKLITDKLNEHLNKAGVAVNLNAKESHYLVGHNIVKTADGLCKLIDFCREDGTEVFAEEAGHFVIGAATETTLYDRLINLLDKVDLHEFFSDEEIQAAYREDNPLRELAGRLVGKNIHKQLDQGPVKNLIDRIFSTVKKFFAKMSSSQIKKDIAEINAIAENLAESFIGDNIEGSITNALNYLEKRNHAALSSIDKALEDSIKTLNQLVEDLKSVKENWLAGVIQDIIIDVSTKNKDINFVNSAAEGIVTLVMQLSQMLQTERDASGITKEFTLSTNPTQFVHEVAAVAPNYIRMHTLISAITSVLHNIENVVSENRENLRTITLDYEGNQYNPHFEEHYQALQDLTSRVAGSFATILYQAERKIALKHLEFLLGADYIETADKLLWDGTTKGKHITLETLFDNIPEMGWGWQFLGQCANSPDVIAQLYDQAMNQALYEANQTTELDFQKFELLREDLKKSNIKDQRIFFEKDENGKITNNIIYDLRLRDDNGQIQTYTVRWATFEKEAEELRNSEYKKWYQTNKDKISKLSPTTQKHLFERHFHDIQRKWRKENAVWDYKNEVWAPSPYAKNDLGEYKYRYDNPLTTEQKEWLQKYKDLIADIDSRIEGHKPVHRAPQFHATFINLIDNKIREYKSVTVGIASGIWNYIKQAIRQENNPEFFGSEATYNSKEEAKDSFVEVMDRTRRVPLFGINKIKDTSNMSTDLISSGIAYATMANRNSANSKIENFIRIGLNARETVEERNKKAAASKRQEERILKTITQYRSHVDKLLFGIGMKQVKIKGVTLNNIAKGLNMFASKKYLGGNVSGGITNASTGTIELFKEAFAGENFTIEDLNKAFRTYFLGIGGVIGDHYTGDDTSKISLFGQRYQISSSDEFKYMNFGTKEERVAEALWEDFFMLPYSMGEHFMQTVPFIAMAQKKMLYDEHGNEISLWDALIVNDGEYQKWDEKKQKFIPMSTGKQVLNFGKTILFNESEGGKKYKDLQDDLQNLKQYTHLQWHQLSDYGKKYLNTQGFTQEGVSRIEHNTLVSMLKEEAERLTYNKLEDNKFQRKTRQVVNNMHGVYNSVDKTMAQRTLVGSLLLTMRGYALGLLEKNWGQIGYRVHAGHEQEGAIKSYLKVLSHALVNRDERYGETEEETMQGDPIYKRGYKSSAGWKLLWYASLGLLSKNTEQKIKDRGISDFQYRNLKRALFGRLASYLLASLWCIGFMDDDEEEDATSYTLSMMGYFACRVFFEQIAFTSGYGLMYEVNSTSIASLSAIMGTLEDIEMGIGSLIWTEYDKDSFWAKRYRYKKYDGEKNVSKSLIRLQKSLPYYREKFKVKDWDKATEGILYVREQQSK